MTIGAGAAVLLLRSRCVLLLLSASEQCAQRLFESLVSQSYLVCKLLLRWRFADSRMQAGGTDALAASSRCSFVEKAACRKTRLVI